MSLNQAAAHFMLAGSGSVARWLKVYEERGEAGLRALKIGTKRNIAISVDPEKAASALELSKVKWHTEFGHLNRGDMLTSEQHWCSNEKKKF